MNQPPVNGGWPARRAVVRWATRLVRREWRKHLLILSLLTVAVAGAVSFSCAIHNLASADARADFGDANHSFLLEDPDAATLPAEIDRARAWFGAVDAIGHRPIPVPGSVERLDYRSQDPDGPFGGPLLELRSGRYPTADGEVAMTEDAAELLGTSVGAEVTLEGRTRHVVGLVENPSDLRDDFVLVPPSELPSSEAVTVLVEASDAHVRAFRPPDSVHMISSDGEVPQDVVAAVISLVVGTLVLFLVALIAAASFTVIAQRRLPQLGMLSAVGATEKHVRLAMLASGAVTGVVAALLGAVLGLGGWLALEPTMERGVNRRIDAYDIPWWLVVAGMVLAVTAATAAAWWPGRTMSRIPPVLALSGRPPRPAALHRSALVAFGVLAVGVICLSIGSRQTGNRVSGADIILLGAGTVGLVAGVLLVSPIAVRALARLAGWVPVGPRVALRDLGRYQGRSSAAVAAIGLALAIPVTTVAVAAAGANGAGPDNLPANQLLVGSDELDLPFVPEDDDLAALQAGVEALSAALPETEVIRLDVAKDPSVPPNPRFPGVEPIMVARPMDDGWNIVSPVYVATPELLAALGLDPDQVTAGDDVVTVAGRDLQILVEPPAGPDRATQTRVGEQVATPGGLPRSYTSLPRALIAPDRLRERGWEVAPSGRWLITAPAPLTGDDLSVARDVASRHGLAIESREDDGGLVQLRFGAVTIGLLVALAILAMTVGLIRAESSREVRTLVATGAASTTRRNITATTAAGLAALGAGLGIGGAYLGLAMGGVPNLLPLPALDLSVVALGLPVAAAAAGWLLAGREPTGVARRPID